MKTIPRITIAGATKLTPVEMNRLHFDAPRSDIPLKADVRPASTGSTTGNASTEIKL